MGFYIQTGSARNKANDLITKFGATEVKSPDWDDVPEGKALVCVIDNRAFDAAGYCYSKQEFEEFNNPQDNRPKRWLLMDKATVEKETHFPNSTVSNHFGR